MGQRAFEAESAPPKPGGGVGESQPAAGERHAEGGGFDVDGGAEAKDGEPSPGQGAFQRPVGEVEADPGHTLSESGPCAKVSAAGLFAQGLMPPTSRESIDRAITPPPAPRCGPSPPTYYFWMNTRRAPFDDVKVRQAINYAVDPEALNRIFGGRLHPTQQILPPGMPGYEEYKLYPGPDMNKAKQLIAEANPADRDITVWTDDEPDRKRIGEYYHDLLTQLGFNATLKVIAGDVYWTTIGNQSTPDVDTGFADWFQDFPHPDDFFRPLLHGDSILPTNGNNYSRVNIPANNAKQDELLTKLIGDGGVEQQYADLDKSYMDQAVWAPYGNEQYTTFVSDRMDFDKSYHHLLFNQDYTSFAIK